jgi:hypothetical protein
MSSGSDSPIVRLNPVVTLSQLALFSFYPGEQKWKIGVSLEEGLKFFSPGLFQSLLRAQSGASFSDWESVKKTITDLTLEVSPPILEYFAFIIERALISVESSKELYPQSNAKKLSAALNLAEIANKTNQIRLNLKGKFKLPEIVDKVTSDYLTIVNTRENAQEYGSIIDNIRGKPKESEDKGMIECSLEDPVQPLVWSEEEIGDLLTKFANLGAMTAQNLSSKELKTNKIAIEVLFNSIQTFLKGKAREFSTLKT